jgi:hypothetical protein
MISRDYTKEVGIPTQKKTVPRALAFVVLAFVAVGISFGVAAVINASKAHDAEEKAAANPPPAATAQVVAPSAETASAK